jgi:hypothetical protein
VSEQAVRPARPRRTRPLTADRTPSTDSTQSTNGSEAHAVEAASYDRLNTGVRKLRVGGGALRFNDRTLMVVGSVLAVIGLVAIFVGWYGASHSPFLFQQIPYLISGGLFGLGLVFLGSIFYFAHWLTELVREGRSQSAAMIDAIGRLEDTIKQYAAAPPENDVNGSLPAAPAAPGASVALVATGKGSMAHRPDCVVVAGKQGLRRVTAADGLEPCKLCDSYSTEIEAAYR